jgi:hypothetical protein
MDAVVSFLVTYVGEFAAALLAKAGDPIAWVACVGGVLLGGAAIRWRPNSWAWPAAFAGLVVAVRVLADAYSSPVSRGDKAALAFLLVGGILAGSLLVWSLRRRSV